MVRVVCWLDITYQPHVSGRIELGSCADDGRDRRDGFCFGWKKREKRTKSSKNSSLKYPPLLDQG